MEPYPWANPSPRPKQHLDRFSRFYAGLTIAKDRQTDHATPSVTIGRTAMAPNNKEMLGLQA